jgi:hypothetical protein
MLVRLNNIGFLTKRRQEFPEWYALPFPLPEPKRAILDARVRTLPMSVHGNRALSDYSPTTTLPVPLTEINSVERNAVPLHLLIVDDDEPIREVCRTVAEECGMKGGLPRDPRRIATLGDEIHRARSRALRYEMLRAQPIAI